MRKTILKWITTFSLTVAMASPALASSGPPSISARAWLLMDGDSGQVLAQINGEDQNYPASTTKILTALVAVEHGHLQDVYTINTSATQLPPDSTICELVPGERQSLDALLYGLLLPSGNDCALAIAEGETSGHVDQFMNWMNEESQALGLQHSHFTNPHGLHDPDHYTTAHDLAIISRAAFQNDLVRDIAGTKSYQMPGHNAPMSNHDQLLYNYSGAVAGKTGFTDQAGATLVTAARRDGHYLIGVIMGEQNLPHTYQDMANLLDFGFASFQQRQLVAPNQGFGSIPVTSGTTTQVNAVTSRGFSISLERDATGLPADVQMQPTLAPKLLAPVHKGDKVGDLKISVGGTFVGSVDLVAATEVATEANAAGKPSPWFLITLRWLVYVMAILVGLRILGATLRSWRRRRRSRYRLRGSYIHSYRASNRR